MIPCIHKTMVFGGCALPGVGICPRWEGILWMRSAGEWHLSTLGGCFVDAHCRGSAFVHAGRVFCGGALPGGGLHPRWEGILWIDAPAGNGFSRKDTFFGDKSISFGAAMEFSPGNWPHLGTKFPPTMASPGNCYHLWTKFTAGSGFSRKDTFFGDKSISFGAAMEFSPGNWPHLGTKFPPTMASPGNCYHLGSKLPSGSGFSRKDTFFGDKSISLGAAMEFSPGNWPHLGTKFPAAMVSPGNCYHLGTKFPAAMASPGNCYHLGTKFPAGSGFSQKLLPFGDKNQHFMACIAGSFADICSFLKKIWPTAE